MARATIAGAAGPLRTVPLYLAAFCFLFPLSVFNLYSDYYSWHGLVPATALFLVLALLIFAIFRPLIPNRHVAALFALVTLIGLFPKSIGVLPAFPLLAGGGAILLALRVWQRRAEPFAIAALLPVNFTLTANVVALATLAAVGGKAIGDELAAMRRADAITAERLASLRAAMPAAPPATLPHIVHIVLDGYSRADVLRDTYGFDNAPFLDALRRRGFHIADKAATPFNQTLFVMSSIFSMGPVVDAERFEPPTGGNNLYRRVLAEISQGGAVSEALEDLGYEMQSTPVSFIALQRDDFVKPNGEPPLLGHFGLATTYVFAHALMEESPALRRLNDRFLAPHFNNAAVNYKYLKTIPERRFHSPEGRPLFVYQHVLAPHPPFNITADGGRRPLGAFSPIMADNSIIVQRDEDRRAQYRQGYLDKLRYVNSAILRQIDNLKSSLTGPLIIIVHGDHGGGMHTEQESMEETCVAERFSPLLAVFATDEKVLAEFDEDFNIANLYRAIFRAALNAKLEDLPDSRTFVPWRLTGAHPVERRELAEACPAVRDTSGRIVGPGHLH